MAENKPVQPQKDKAAIPSRHGKRAEERRLRQAEALRANLKKRKEQSRGRGDEK